MKLTRRSCHNRIVEICVEPRNCRRTWLFIYIFVFCRVKKKKESLWNIFILITQPFLYLEGALKLISQEQFKNTTTKIFQVRRQFRGSTQISTLRLWHDLRIRVMSALELPNKIVCYKRRKWDGFALKSPNFQSGCHCSS